MDAAITKGDVVAVRGLLEAGAAPDANGSEALCVALDHKNLCIAHLLLTWPKHPARIMDARRNESWGRAGKPPALELTEFEKLERNMGP